MGCQVSIDTVEGQQKKYKFSSQLFCASKESSNNPQIVLCTKDNSEPNSLDNKLDRTIAYYQEFLEENPCLKYPFDGLGNIEDQVGYFESRIERWYEQSREQGKIHGNPYDALALCLTLKEDVSNSQNWYEDMLGRYPLSEQLHFGLGNIFYKLAQYQQAERCYRKAIDLNPRLDKAYQNIANIYCYKTFDNSHAAQWSKFAMKINQNNEYAALIHAMVTQNIDIKITLLSKLVENHPKYARIYNALGHAFIQKQMFDRAIQWFSKGYMKNPHYYAIPCGLAFCYNKLGKYEMATEWAHKAMELNQNHHEPYHIIGDAYRSKGMLEDAKKWFLKCIDVNPGFDQAYLKLAHLSLELHQEEEAIKYLLKYLQSNEDNVAALFELAKLRMKRKETNECKQTLFTILTISPEHEGALFLLGQLYLKNNQFDESEQIFAQFLKAAKDKQQAKSNLLQLYSRKIEHKLQ